MRLKRMIYALIMALAAPQAAFCQVATSGLPNAAPLVGSEVVPIVQNGTTKQVSAEQIANTATSIPSTAVTGLGTAATTNIGTSGNAIPLLSNGNAWSAPQAFTSSTAGSQIVGTGATSDSSISSATTNLQVLRAARSSPLNKNPGGANEFPLFSSVTIPSGHGGGIAYEVAAMYGRCSTSDSNTLGLDAYDCVGAEAQGLAIGTGQSHRVWGNNNVVHFLSGSDGLGVGYETDVLNQGTVGALNSAQAKIGMNPVCRTYNDCTAAYIIGSDGIAKWRYGYSGIRQNISGTCFLCLLDGGTTGFPTMAGIYADGHALALGSSTIAGSSGSTRFQVFSTGANDSSLLPRWQVGANSTAESGTNSGSDYQICRYADAGSFLDCPIIVNRSSGLVSAAQLAATTLYANNSTVYGKLNLASSSAAGAGLNVGAGTDPTAPNNGDVWGTSSGLAVRANGTTISIGPGINSVTYAKDKGVKCDGTTDDTAALNTMFANATSRTHYVLPQGTCIFSDTLTINPQLVSLTGQGKGATELRYTGTSTTKELLSVYGASSSVSPYEMTLGGFLVSSTTTMTSGYGLHIKWCSYCTLRDIEAGPTQGIGVGPSKLYHGIYIESPNFVTLTDFITTAQQDCLSVAAGGVGQPPQYDVWVQQGKIGDGCTIGLHIGGGVDNIHFDAIMDTSNNRNVVIDNVLHAYKNQEIIFGPRFIADQPIIENYLINDTLTNLANYCSFTIGGIVTYSKAGPGINIANAPNCLITVNASQIVANRTSGIKVGDNSVRLAISPSTHISQNGTYGVEAILSYSNLLSTGAIHDNGSGNYNSLVLPVASSSLYKMPTLTFSGLPACNSATAGTVAFISDASTAVTSWGQTVSAGAGSNAAFVRCGGSAWQAF